MSYIPAEESDTGRPELVRACDKCLEGKESTEGVLDEHHEEVQCIFCDSWNTYEPDNRKKPYVFRCRDCGETFHI